MLKTNYIISLFCAAFIVICVLSFSCQNEIQSTGSEDVSGVYHLVNEFAYDDLCVVTVHQTNDSEALIYIESNGCEPYYNYQNFLGKFQIVNNKAILVENLTERKVGDNLEIVFDHNKLSFRNLNKSLFLKNIELLDGIYLKKSTKADFYMNQYADTVYFSQLN